MRENAGSVRKSEKCGKKWNVWDKVKKVLEKVRYVRKKWEIWEKVRYVRKSEKNVGKIEIYDKKCENCEKIEIWGKVRFVWKFWEKVRGVRKRERSVKIVRKSERPSQSQKMQFCLKCKMGTGDQITHLEKSYKTKTIYPHVFVDSNLASRVWTQDLAWYDWKTNSINVLPICTVIKLW